jgi:type IV secretory pathway TrbD component
MKKLTRSGFSRFGWFALLFGVVFWVVAEADRTLAGSAAWSR